MRETTTMKSVVTPLVKDAMILLTEGPSRVTFGLVIGIIAYAPAGAPTDAAVYDIGYELRTAQVLPPELQALVDALVSGIDQCFTVFRASLGADVEIVSPDRGQNGEPS